MLVKSRAITITKKTTIQIPALSKKTSINLGNLYINN